jgi:ABC-type iron transport system FetAB permease component
MYGKRKGSRIRRSIAFENWSITFCAAALTLLLLIAAEKRSIPPKWVTATIGTVAPFTFVIYVYRRRLLRWSFWVALSICLLIHTVTVAVIFRYVLNDFQSFSIWLWFPIMLSEVFALLIAVKKMGETLTGKRDTTRLTF